MKIKHDFIIHLVNMVSGQDQDILRIIAVYVFHILVNSIGSSWIPFTSAAFSYGCRNRKHHRYYDPDPTEIPIPICVFSRSGWYCVSTPTVSIPELIQLLSGKSIILYFPPKATAGFATSAVNTPRRLPCLRPEALRSFPFESCKSPLANSLRITFFLRLFKKLNW